jgi:carboxyl-terminal processing protease
MLLPAWVSPQYRWLGITLCWVIWSLVTPVSAQNTLTIRLPQPAVAQTSEIDRVLSQGQAFENNRRWAEALTLYEEASRRYPKTLEIEQRLELSRIHYDLSRRYADNSFRRTLLTLSEQEALELYNQVLSRVYAHSVSNPDWAGLIRRGTIDLQIALADKQFSEYHLRGRDDNAIRQLQSDIANLTRTAPVDRVAAKNQVQQIARLANQRIAISPAAVILEYTCGAVGSLDEYSTFLTSGQLTDLYSQIDGNFVGLGVELKTQNNQLLIVSVIPNSPAERAGLKKGDKILEVDGQLTSSMNSDKAADLLQGAEGTTATLVVQNEQQAARRLLVRREQVDVPSIEHAHIVDAATGTAYLKLAAFQKSTGADLDKALWALHRQGMRSLIIDLRGNPGGLLTASVDAADRFIETGVLVSTRGRNPAEDFTYTAQKAGTWSLPLAVLIDGDSASASEIFAGAIRDHQRGSIVGSRSFGKGSVQGIFPLNVANTGIRLTTAKFYSPLGKPFSKVGVEPTVEVRQATKPLVPDLQNAPANTTILAQQATPPEDTVLQTAVQVLQGNRTAAR